MGLNYDKKNKKYINVEEVNIDLSRYDWDTYGGRFKHFWEITNPFNLFTSDVTLGWAKRTVENQRRRKPHNCPLMVKELYQAKILYDSAFHPDTGEKQFILGRMAAQVPFNAVLGTLLNFFHKRVSSIMMLQWLNQTFNATVNYTNKSPSRILTNQDIVTSYFAATTTAIAVSLISKARTRYSSSLVKRFVPFFGCSGAHLVNTPLMRSTELKEGTVVYDDYGRKITLSKNATKRAISQVIITKIGMSALPMMGVPSLIHYLAKQGIFFKHRFFVELFLSTVGFSISTPASCALFKQYQTISYRELEEKAQKEAKFRNRKRKQPHACCYYFNKDL